MKDKNIQKIVFIVAIVLLLIISIILGIAIFTRQMKDQQNNIEIEKENLSTITIGFQGSCINYQCSSGFQCDPYDSICKVANGGICNIYSDCLSGSFCNNNNICSSDINYKYSQVAKKSSDSFQKLERKKGSACGKYIDCIESVCLNQDRNECKENDFCTCQDILII